MSPALAADRRRPTAARAAKGANTIALIKDRPVELPINPGIHCPRLSQVPFPASNEHSPARARTSFHAAILAASTAARPAALKAVGLELFCQDTHIKR